MKHGESWSEKLTEEQNNLCYEIQFSLIRAIINFDHDRMWEFMLKALESEKERKEGKE